MIVSTKFSGRWLDLRLQQQTLKGTLNFTKSWSFGKPRHARASFSPSSTTICSPERSEKRIERIEDVAAEGLGCAINLTVELERRGGAQDLGHAILVPTALSQHPHERRPTYVGQLSSCQGWTPCRRRTLGSGKCLGRGWGLWDLRMCLEKVFVHGEKSYSSNTYLLI
jgi:hypothetical protein